MKQKVIQDMLKELKDSYLNKQVYVISNDSTNIRLQEYYGAKFNAVCDIQHKIRVLYLKKAGQKY